MSRDDSRVAEYLGHILQAIERIHRYTDDMDAAGFSQDEMTQDAVIRNFEIIGEACRNIEREDPGFAVAHPESPLSVADEMRNTLAHGYFKVDLAIVWRSIENDLPPLHEKVKSILESRAKTDGPD